MKARAATILGTIAFVVAFGWSYAAMVAPQFAYMGYKYVSPNPVFLGLAIFFSLLPSFWMPVRVHRPSQIILWVLYILVFIPSMLLPLSSGLLSGFSLVPLWLVLLLSLTVVWGGTQLPRVRFPRFPISTQVFWGAFLILLAAMYAYVIRTFGFRLRLVSFNDVYDVRGAYVNAAAGAGGLGAYLISWLANAFNPFLLAWGLHNRRLSPILAGTLGELAIYAITGQKSAFFIPVLLVALVFALQRGGRTFGIFMTWSWGAVVVVSAAVDTVTHSIWMTSLFVRRLIAVPGILTGMYYQFFSQNPKVLLSNSILRGLEQYPYSLDPAHLMGYVYFGNASTGANANIWASAFADFGFIGVLIFTFLLVFVLWLYDSFTLGTDFVMAALMIGASAVSLTSSALFTSLLTHGIAIILILGYLAPRSEPAPGLDLLSKGEQLT